MTVNRYKKYNSVAAREWPNNAYSYNRNNEKLLSYKKDTVNKIIKSYFNLTEKEKSFKSKRMRDLIKRSSLLRLFNSKGIIKQNSDKVNVSIHTFNRRKSKMARNLFSFNKFLSKYKKHNIFTSVRALKVVNNYNNKSLLERIQLRDSNLTSLISKLNLTNYNNLFLHDRKKSKKFLSSSSPLLLTKNNNVKYHNIYMKNMYYPTNEINTKRKLNVKLNSSNTRLLASTFKRNKKLFYKKKKNNATKKKRSII